MVQYRPYSSPKNPCVRGLCSMRVRVEGDSMLPALRSGDWLWVWRGAPVRPGDLVVARLPSDPSRLIVKRAAWEADGGWWLESDNQRASGRRDSWDFGALPPSALVGRVMLRYWPLTFRRAR
ncbi:S24 family peptidase [Streptosporangium roseum]|uniref:S24 family peptidase n=1 Tax=Streptosporangium roseum TaxID=2001 RepID=UPI003324291D